MEYMGSWGLPARQGPCQAMSSQSRAQKRVCRVRSVDAGGTTGLIQKKAQQAQGELNGAAIQAHHHSSMPPLKPSAAAWSINSRRRARRVFRLPCTQLPTASAPALVADGWQQADGCAQTSVAPRLSAQSQPSVAAVSGSPSGPSTRRRLDSVPPPSPRQSHDSIQPGQAQVDVDAVMPELVAGCSYSSSCRQGTWLACWK